MKCTRCKICYYLIVIKKEKNKKIIFLYQGGYIMKLSRNVLVGSLATVGMVLGAVAPAVTAQAATTTGKVGSDGKVTQTESTDVGQLGSGDPAIAFDGGDGSTYGTATANSNANVKVVSGVLVLDQVPDFGFGSAASDSTVSLKDNNATGTAVDGNNKGVLSVIDARSETPGFTLSANLGQFTGTDGEAATNGNQFVLTLNPEEIFDGNGESASTTASPIKTSTAAMTSTGAAADGKIVMQPTAKSYKVGTLKTTFSDADAASLYVPKVSNNDVKNP